MIRFYSFMLIICSTIGFTGHYLQFGIARLTPWIPATVGILILIIHYWVKDKKGFLKYLPVIFVFVFGCITTNMCIKFLPQEFQPVRKKIIFSLMTISAWTTVTYQMWLMLKLNEKQT